MESTCQKQKIGGLASYILYQWAGYSIPPTKSWGNFIIDVCCSAQFCQDWSGILLFAIASPDVGAGDQRREWYIWHAIPRMFEGLGFQNQEVRGMQSAMRRSAAEGQGKYQVFLVNDWEEACSVEVIFCYRNLCTT